MAQNPIYRLLMRMQGGGSGWSENYCFSSPLLTPSAFAATLQPLCQARVNCMGSPFFMNGYRISQIRDENGDVLSRAGAPVKSQYFPAGQAVADEQPVGVLLQMKDVTEEYSKQNIMGGIPIGVCTGGYIYNPVPSNFGANVASFAQQLSKAGCGWIGSNALLDDVTVIDYTTNASLITTFTIDGLDLLDTFDVLDVVKIRIRSLNYRQSVFIGEMLVQILTGTTFQNLSPRACGPFISNGFAAFYENPPPFRVASFIGEAGCGEHKRGNRSWTSVGRRRAQKRV